TEPQTAEGVYRELIGRILSGRSGLQQIWFDASVLTKYMENDDYQVLRTDSAGRLGKRRSWSVDFGIVDGTDDLPTLLHLPAESLGARLPAAEREHWQDHAVALPMSLNYLRMQLHPEACIDDGEIRSWTAEQRTS
ncbi:MAG: hypothetical protein R3191_01270, partial [Anaerolineales bacterium]|nr:hypothetical protein [Anaerolineales bacterium]